MQQIFEQQPGSAHGMWNYVEYRPLEGFVFAVTPFNFTSIAGNLPTSPAMMGNTVVWKPASTAVYAAYWLMQLFKEAGLPDGVINMVPGSGGQIGDQAMSHPDLGGVHFTGSTEVFQGMWRTIGSNITSYKSYPRIVGETGGKDFVFAHVSADTDELAANLIRGTYEYQGQKCSATSRAYLPESLWKTFRDQLCSQIEGSLVRRRHRLYQLHGRRDRSDLVRPSQELHRRRRNGHRRRYRLWWHVRRQHGILRLANGHPGVRSSLQGDGDRTLRPSAHGLRLSGTASTSRRSSCVTRRRPTP